jgi:hypothetical protein
MYKLFQMETQREPEILPAPEDEVILERDGLHIINSRALNPDAETKKTLDHQFLNLVESLINPPKSGAISSKSGD